MSQLLLSMGRGVLIVIAALILVLPAADVLAQDSARERDDRERRSQTIDPRFAQDILSAYEKFEEDDHASAIQDLTDLLQRRRSSMAPFDIASVLQIRGSAYASVDDYDRALSDFDEAYRLDVFPFDIQEQLLFNMAQLNFVLERFRVAIDLFREWMQIEGVEITHVTYFMIAAAHYNLQEYSQALGPIRQAIDISPEPDKRYYDFNNALYTQLDMPAERAELLEEMIIHWTDEVTYWRQLSALYMELGEQMKAFGVLESAYVNGLLTQETDIIVLAQYMSNFDNPHRGAEIVEREMDNGVIERTTDNLELLSQLWSQAREHAKSIPVLREAAELSDDGMLSFRLGQSLLADEQNEAAERAFVEALDKGDLDSSSQSQAWMLLGNARFNQAGPGDREQRLSADRAFAQAENFNATRRQAQDWREYIRAINRTEAEQARLEREERERMASAAHERFISGCRAQQIAGHELSQACEEALALEDADAQAQPDADAENEDGPQ